MLDLGTRGRYAHAAIGKWHLGNNTVGGADAPNLAGYSHFSGTLRSIDDYFAFEDVANGTVRTVRRYATSQEVDDALDWIQSTPAPWLCYLAFNAVHKPYHAPPAELHSVDLPGPYRPKGEGPQRPFYNAMLEALDSEIGRLLRSIDPQILDHTTVIFIGDNGSHWDVTLPPFDSERSKASLYEGGINVPLIIAGPLVERPGREVSAVVDATDVFATVAEIAGVDLDAVVPMAAGPLDSVSLLPYLGDPNASPVRTSVYAEIFSPNGVGPNENVKRAIRDQRYKLIRTGWSPGGDEFYDLVTDPFERRNLLLQLRPSDEALAAYEGFDAALRRQATLGASPVSPTR
jgi:arylsulfatase A-like enzyme